jgi:tetratricopeptide (TPR) repeat protein
MNKKCIAFCLFFLTITVVFGASYKVTMLLRELNQEKNPHRKAELYIDVANEVKGANPDSAIYYFAQAENISRSLTIERDKEIIQVRLMIGRASVEIAKGNFDKGWSLDSMALLKARKLKNRELEAATLMSQGSIYYNRSQFDQAQKCNEAALKLIRKTNDRKTEGKILTNMGTIEFMYGNAAKADSFFRLPLKLAKMANDDDLLAASLLNIGLLNVYRGQYTIAEGYIRQSADVYQKIDGKDGLVLCYQNLSTIWVEQGNLEKAIEYSTLNQNLSMELGDKIGLSKAYQNLGECYAQIGDYEKAIEFFIKSLEIKTALGDPKEIAATNSSIGHIHYQQGDFKHALEYYRKSLEDFGKTGYALGIAASYSDIGNILAEQNKQDSALFYFSKSEEIYSKNELVNYLASVYINMGKVYFARKNFDKSEYYYKKAEEIKTQVGDILGVYNVSGLFATMYYRKSLSFPEFSAQRKSILNTALTYAQKAYSLADSMNHLPGQRESAGYLMDIYSALGNPVEAIKYAKIKLDKTDSLYRKQRAEALVNAEIRWKAEKKQAEIVLLEQDKALQAKVIEQKSTLANRLSIIIGAILLVLILIIVISILYIKNKAKQKDIEFHKHLNDITRLKMQNLNNRLSPHLFFNMLGSVSGDARDPEKVRHQIHHVANLLRMSLENTERTAISLREEIEMVKSYVELQRSRIPQPFSCEFHIDDAVDLNKQIPCMMLQIPVENAIKHGLMPMEGEKMLTVFIEKVNDKLEIKVEDNGIGRENSKGRTTGTGTGLNVLLQTIRLLNQQNKEPVLFMIIDREPQGTIVKITIPENYTYLLQN